MRKMIHLTLDAGPANRNETASAVRRLLELGRREARHGRDTEHRRIDVLAAKMSVVKVDVYDAGPSRRVVPPGKRHRVYAGDFPEGRGYGVCDPSGKGVVYEARPGFGGGRSLAAAIRLASFADRGWDWERSAAALEREGYRTD